MGLSILLALRHHLLAGITVLSIAVGITAGSVDSALHRGDCPVEGEYHGAGTVTYTGTGTLVVELSSPFGGNCYLSVPQSFQDVALEGDIVSFTAEFAPVLQRRDTPWDADLSTFFYCRHIECRGRVVDNDISVTGEATGMRWTMHRWRERLVDVIVSSNLSETAQSFLCAVLLGDGGWIDASRREQFTRAGTAHVLALSGMHVVVIVGLISWLLAPLGLLRMYRARMVIIASVLFLYVALTGMSASVVRAAIMAGMVMIARESNRPHSSLNFLCLAAWIILLLSPRELFAPGFQLSFMAVGGLILVPTAVELKMTRHNVKVIELYRYILYSLAAVIATLPLSIYYFHTVPLYFLLANIPASLFMAPLMVCGIVVTALGLGGVSWSWPDFVTNLLSDIIDSVTRWIVAMPGSNVSDISLPWWGVVVLYVSLAGSWLAWKRRSWAIASMALLSIMVVGMVVEWRPSVGDVLFISRQGNRDTIVLTAGGSGRVVLTSRYSDVGTMGAYLDSRYAREFSRRGVSSLMADVSLRDRIVEWNVTKIAVVSQYPDTFPAVKVDYLLLTRSEKVDIDSLCRRLSPDTVLVGVRVDDGEIRSLLQSLGIPSRSLSTGYGLFLERNR